jgi:hypothetical protein
MEMKEFFGFGIGIIAVVFGLRYAKKAGFAAESPGQGTGFSGIIGESGTHAANQDANTHVAHYCCWLRCSRLKP